MSKPRRLLTTFYAKAFGLSEAELSSSSPTFSSSGTYLERDPEGFVYYLEDLQNGKKVIAASKPRLDILRSSFGPTLNFDASSIRQAPTLRDLVLEHHDVDHCLLEAKDFLPQRNAGLHVRAYEESLDPQLEAFYAQCPEHDVDTLDFRPDTDTAFVIMEGREIAAMSRFATISIAPELVDITVMVRPGSRGRGLATPLVSRVVEEALARGLWPKYRVEDDNHPSLAVARRLGFTATHKLLAWLTDRPTR